MRWKKTKKRYVHGVSTDRFSKTQKVKDFEFETLRIRCLISHVLGYESQSIGAEPLYYTDIAERFSTYDFQTVARALGHLHASEKLWQDSRGRMCVRGSPFAAKPPG